MLRLHFHCHKQQQNFMIENMGFSLFSVGATIGRPLHLPEFHADNQRFFIQKTNIKFMVKP